MCHTKDPKTGKLVFLALDPFCINEFKLDVQMGTYSSYTQYWGINELQDQQMEFLRDHKKTSQQKHESLSPFYLHQNAQFLIQSQKVTVTIEGQDVSYDQYFYRTNDNQFMFLYPCYSLEKDDLKREVYAQVAENHCYYGSPSLDYKYQTDFNTRQTDYFQEKSIKLSHVDSDCLSRAFQK